MKIAKTAKTATEMVNSFLKESGLHISLQVEEVPTFDVDGVTPCQDFDFWITQGKKQTQLATLGYCSAALLPEIGWKLKTVKDSTKKLFYFVVTATSPQNVIEQDYKLRCQQNWNVIAKLAEAIKSELPDVAILLGSPSQGGWKVDYNPLSLTGVVSSMPHEICPELTAQSAEEILFSECIKFADAAQTALHGSHSMTVLWSLTSRAKQLLIRVTEKELSSESVVAGKLLDAVVARSEDCGFPKIGDVTQYFEKADQFSENVYLTALATLPENEFAEQLTQLALAGLEEWSAHSSKFSANFGFRVKRDKTSEENLALFIAHVEKLIRPVVEEVKPEKTSAKDIAKKAKAKKAKSEEVNEDEVLVLIDEQVEHFEELILEKEEIVEKPVKKAPKRKNK